MIFPPFIKKEATIGLIAPAGKVAPDVIEQAVMMLLEAGFGVVKGQFADGAFHQFAATDDQRLSDLQMMIDHPEINVIVCLRGGYGALRIVDRIDFSPLIKHPKWLVGFSDITVLHAALQKNGIASVHAAMPKNWHDGNSQTEEYFRLFDLLSGDRPSYTVVPNQYNKTGKAAGELCGGNLSLIYAMRGTPYDFDPEGKILFIEDLSEYLYHLDRMMQNLRLGGVLEKISGLVVGHFTEMKDNITPFGQPVEEIILDAVKGYDYPVMFGFPSGHTTPNFPLIMGSSVSIDVCDAGGSLIF